MNMKRLIPIAAYAAIYAQTASADQEMLLGTWNGNDRASEAIYGTMLISKRKISWGGSNPYNPYCQTTYTLVDQYSSETYPDNPFTLVAGRTFTIFKLKLDPQACIAQEGYIQFALPSDQDKYAEVVTYGTDDRQIGWHNFSKLSN